jgi:hypothetical protein
MRDLAELVIADSINKSIINNEIAISNFYLLNLTILLSSGRLTVLET